MGDDYCLDLNNDNIGFIDNDTNKILIKPPASISNDHIFILPSSNEIQDTEYSLSLTTIDNNNNRTFEFIKSVWTKNTTTTTVTLDDTYTLSVKEVRTTSDKKLKKNIKSIGNPIEVLHKLNGYTYLFKKGDNLNAGVIAQEVEKVLPFAVSTDEKNIKSVNYICLIPYMIEGIKANNRDIIKTRELIKKQNSVIYILVFMFVCFYVPNIFSPILQ